MTRVSFTSHLARHVDVPDVDVNGATVRDVLTNAQIDYSGHTLTIDGRNAELTRPMQPGETLMAAKARIRGA